MGFDLDTIEQPVGLQPENHVPISSAAPFENRGRRVPTIIQNRDLVVGWDEWGDGLQHLAREVDLGAELEALTPGTLPIEPPDGRGPQVGDDIDGETQRADRDAQQDVDRAFAEHRLTQNRARQIDEPVHHQVWQTAGGT